MANAPFDMVIFNLLESGVADDVDRLQSQLRRTLLDTMARMHERRITYFDPTAGFSQSGFFSEGFRVVPGTGLEVKLRPGIGLDYQPSSTASSLNGVVGLDDLSGYRALVLLSEMTISGIPAGDATNPRIDIIEVKSPRRVTDPTSRLVLDPSTYTESAQLVNKTATWTSDGQQTVNGAGFVNYKTGTPAASPVAPTVTAGYTKIAETLVTATATSIPANMIADLRSLLSPGVVVCSARVRLSGAGAPEVLSVSAPPGWVLAAESHISHTYEFGLYLIGGTVQGVRATASVVGHTLGTLNIAEIALTSTHLPAVETFSAINFGNAARFNPTYSINGGAWSAYASVVVQTQTGGTTAALALFPTEVDVTLFVEV